MRFHIYDIILFQIIVWRIEEICIVKVITNRHLLTIWSFSYQQYVRTFTIDGQVTCLSQSFNHAETLIGHGDDARTGHFTYNSHLETGISYLHHRLLFACEVRLDFGANQFLCVCAAQAYHLNLTDYREINISFLIYHIRVKRIRHCVG